MPQYVVRCDYEGSLLYKQGVRRMVATFAKKHGLRNNSIYALYLLVKAGSETLGVSND